MKEIPHYVVPTVFYSHPSAPLYWDLSPAKTHGAWLWDLMKLRLLMSHYKKNSARDIAIGKRWICSDSERSTLHRVSVVAVECGVVS